MMAFPEKDGEYILECDASDIGSTWSSFVLRINRFDDPTILKLSNKSQRLLTWVNFMYIFHID